MEGFQEKLGFIFFMQMLLTWFVDKMSGFNWSSHATRITTTFVDEQTIATTLKMLSSWKQCHQFSLFQRC